VVNSVVDVSMARTAEGEKGVRYLFSGALTGWGQGSGKGAEKVPDPFPPSARMGSNMKRDDIWNIGLLAAVVLLVIVVGVGMHNDNIRERRLMAAQRPLEDIARKALPAIWQHAFVLAKSLRDAPDPAGLLGTIDYPYLRYDFYGDERDHEPWYYGPKYVETSADEGVDLSMSRDGSFFLFWGDENESLRLFNIQTNPNVDVRRANSIVVALNYVFEEHTYVPAERDGESADSIRKKREMAHTITTYSIRVFAADMGTSKITAFRAFAPDENLPDRLSGMYLDDHTWTTDAHGINKRVEDAAVAWLRSLPSVAAKNPSPSRR
jgi:hypothetical protein